MKEGREERGGREGGREGERERGERGREGSHTGPASSLPNHFLCQTQAGRTSFESACMR